MTIRRRLSPLLRQYIFSLLIFFGVLGLSYAFLRLLLLGINSDMLAN